MVLKSRFYRSMVKFFAKNPGYPGCIGIKDGAFDFGAKVSPYTPVTTNSISFNTNGDDETLCITPAGTIAALTVVFPPDANSVIGQKLEIFPTQVVTTLTVTSTGLTLKGTAVTALAVNTPLAWRKVAASTWARLL